MTGEQRKAYSPELLDEAVAQVTTLAEHYGVSVALCGGLAMQSYGSDRLTKDADFVVSEGLATTFPGLTVVRPLTFGGVEARAPNGVPVDLIVRADQLSNLYVAALASSVSRPGIPCRVVTPEYLATMKLAAGRARDILDLHWLISANVIDRAMTRSLVERLVGGWYAARDFDTHVEDAELEAERERKAKGT